MRMYEIIPAYREVMNDIEANDGELTTELKARLDAVTVTLEQKIEAYCSWYREISKQTKAIEEELNYIRRRKLASENIEAFIKSQVLEALETLGVERGQFGNRKTWIQPNSQATLEIQDESAVPDDFLVVEKKVDRESLKSYIVSGGEVPGCTVARGSHLRIS